MKKNHKNKAQRKAASKRKTWTNAERFWRKQKNISRLLGISKKIEVAEKAAELVAEVSEEIKNEQG
jgi:hypothetical protein